MKFSLNWIKEYVDIKEKPESIADALTVRAFEVESVDQERDDTIFNIDVLPNRPDALSHYGMAREIAAEHDLPFKPREKSTKSDEKNGDVRGMLSVAIKDADACPRYAARVIEDVYIGESPDWLKARLTALGLQPINTVVDITNYVMLELGQPLHAFDYDLLQNDKGTAKTIVVDRARNGESFIALDEMHTEYMLSNDMLTIRDGKHAVAIAGIKGGKSSAVHSGTKRIVLEAANFNPAAVRRTSQKLGLTTDASVRFSYGADREAVIDALDRAVELIEELAEGKAVRGVIDEYPKKAVAPIISVDKEYACRLSGTQLPFDDAVRRLTALGFKVEEDNNTLNVTVPSFRTDCAAQEDIIEEMVRMYGYENIVEKSPTVQVFPDIRLSREEHIAQYRDSKLWDFAESIQFRDLIKNIFAGFGFLEAYTYSFISEGDKELYAYRNLIELRNPMSHKARYLRPNLVSNLLRAAEENFKHAKKVSLFEVGRVFTPEETRRVAGVYGAQGNTELFFELKGIVDSFLRSLGLSSFHYNDITNWNEQDKELYHPGIGAEIKVNDTVIGVVGEINPYIRARSEKSGAGFKSSSVAAFECDLEKLMSVVQAEREYEPIAKYPAVVRDISLVVDADVRISEILNRIEGADEKRIIQDVDIFDIYMNDEAVTKGKKSVAFHLVFQSPDRTLTDEEVNAEERNVKHALEKGLGAEIR